MCFVVKKNVSFDIDNPEEFKVYEAVQSQPHKQRSKFLLQLAYAGLMNMNSSDDDHVISAIQNDIATILAMIKTGSIRINEVKDECVSESIEEEIDTYGIDEDDLELMLGW